MAIDAPHVLPSDVVIKPVSRLDPAIRDRLDCPDDAVAVARPSIRLTAKVVHPQAAALLQTFSTPRRLTDAIADFAEERQSDPLELFDRVYPFLERMIGAGVLVEAGSYRERKPQRSLARGSLVGAWEVGSCVHLLDDAEVYQVRDGRGRIGALKIVRGDHPRPARLLANERQVLDWLDGAPSPSLWPPLWSRGIHAGRPYLVLGWCAGVDIETAASELRALAAPERRRRLLEVSRAIVSTYATLHEHGVVHADVHEKNVRADAAGMVRLIDFGWSRVLDRSRRGRVGRAGAGHYYEPEYARACLAGRRAPPLTTRGEQYIVAAMLYSVWTGAPYADFKLDRTGMLGQIATEEPRPFGEHGAESEPDIERILQRAMSKRPAGRYRSMRALAAELDRASATAVQAQAAHALKPMDLHRASDRILARLRVAGPAMRDAVERPPTCPVSCGAAGVAYALYRLAMIRDDPVALDYADVWAARAAAGLSSPTALHSEREQFTPETTGPISLFHAAPGIHLVRALIARARRDFPAMRAAAERFVDACRVSATFIDVTHGWAGVLLGCALLRRSARGVPGLTGLTSLGHATQRRLWRALRDAPPVGTQGDRINTGVAHGWGGMLYATLRWCDASRTSLDPLVQHRLAELARCAEPSGRGLRWRWFIVDAPDPETDRFAPGWCNGSAGLVHTWLLAHVLTKRRRFMQLALGAAWNCWESEVNPGPNLCCGLTGRAYALLAAYRATGSPEWLRRARALGERALAEPRVRGRPADPDVRVDSLYYGDLGVALLLAELEFPTLARMPLFEPDD